MIVITTPTGQIGHQTVTRLLEREEPVRVIVRDPGRLDGAIRDRVEVTTGSHGDPAVLDRALDGADGLLWLVPTSFDGGPSREHYLAFARTATAAIRAHGVTHVVGISSAGHDWPEPAGVLSAAFAMDAELAASGAAYRALSMPGFMENILRDLDGLRDRGILAQPYEPDRIVPLVATRDIAAVAAGLLSDRGWEGQQNLPVFGPDRLTPRQIADVIGEVLKREVTYTQVPLDALSAGMIAHGASEAVVHDMVEMTTAQNAGIYASDQAIAVPTPTSLRTWCQDVLRPAVAHVRPPAGR